MDVSNKLRIFCSDFQENITLSYSELREEANFWDVTLASEDQEIKAHRVILSASSLGLKNILLRHNHSNPMIYLTGVKSKTSASIIDFIYLGEVNIYEDDLNDFINLADELQLKGLTGKLVEQFKANDNLTKEYEGKMLKPESQTMENTQLETKETKYIQKVMNTHEINKPLYFEENAHPTQLVEGKNNLKYLALKEKINNFLKNLQQIVY